MSEAIRGHQRPSERPSEAIRGHPRESEAIREPTVIVKESPSEAGGGREGVRGPAPRGRRLGRRARDLEHHRADREVTPKSILLSGAAHVPEGYAVELVVLLLADGGHEVDLDALGRRTDEQVRLRRVHVLVLGRVRQDRRHIYRGHVQVRPAVHESLNALHDGVEGHLGGTGAQAERKVQVIGLLAQ
jgi:hypothetical protein